MRIQGWLLPIAIGSVAVIALGDAVLMRHRPLEVPKATVPDKIGLAAAQDGDGLRLEWNRTASIVRRANHALLYIEDGKYQSQLSLSGQELTESSVRYWPDTQNVRFRLELYHGSESVADEVRIAAERSAPVVHTASRTVVERARPSPFVRTRPEVVRRQIAPPVVSARVVPPEPEPEPEPVVQPQRKGWISKIPLLRRLKKHPQTPDPVVFDETPSHR